MTDPRQQADEALHEQRAWLRVTLSSIGDGVITCDDSGGVTFLNSVAQTLTGWTQEEAAGVPLATVFNIVNQETRHTVENPATRALREGAVVGLANHTLLISKDGTERPIDDSAAPIRNDKGEVAGVVLVFRDITERYRQQQTIEEALAYAENIIATLREPFVVLDKNLRVQTASRSFYNAFHVTPEDTQGRSIYDLGNRQWDIPHLRSLLGEVLSNNHPVHNFGVEHDFQALGKRAMLLNARRFVSLDHRPELILLAIEDITDRKGAEDKLRDSEERYRSLVEQVKDYAIFRTDPEGRATTWNKGVERVLGFTEAEFAGKDIVPTIFTPEDVQSGAAQHELDHAAAHGTSSNDRWMRQKDGSRFFAAGVTTVLKDEKGELIGFTKVIRDQTERKELEAAVQASEVRYRRLFESAKDGILILDAASGTIIDANPFMSYLLGYSHDEFRGKELWEIGLFKDRSGSEATVRELQQNGYIRYEHLPLESSRGRRVEVEIVANAYREDHKTVIQCNIRDITERSRLEKQTQEQAAALSDLHRRKDEFMAMLSHELRNPLAPIANAVQLLRLQRGSENDLQRQARTIIERQVGQLKHLVDDLLEVSRITTGRVQLRQERVALSGIVERAVETTRPLIKPRRHELTLTLPSQPIWLYADAARLEQVVVNLLTNAAKYTDEGGHIWLTVEQEDDVAVLRLRDTGVGIAPELLPRIFDLFTQAERSLERSEGGLGIGLCLVQRLVELHGGTVEARSVLAEGSEFVVRLPMTSLPPSPSASRATAQPTGKSCRVLVVDDNRDTAESLAILLRASGHDVRTAHDGPTADEAAVDYRPDVVCLDIGLPGLNGYEVARRIRQQPAPKNAVLVAMTGYGQETDRQRSQEAGFDHHLVKPVDFDTLQKILATVAEKAT